MASEYHRPTQGLGSPLPHEQNEWLSPPEVNIQEDTMAHSGTYLAARMAGSLYREQPDDNPLQMRSLFARILTTTVALGVFGMLAAAFPGTANSQEPNPTQQSVPDQANPITEQNGIYIYRVKVVQRNLDCVNYLHRSGSTTIGFDGTPLLPNAKGEAKVTSERGGITIEAKFDGLTPANGFGKEYLTYVLWAISPDGRAQNLGEVLPAGTKNNIRVTTALQSFGMIVTAEPYFSVTEPSDVVVIQNVIRPDKTNGVMEKVNANYYPTTEGCLCRDGGCTHRNQPDHARRAFAAGIVRGG